MVEFLRKLMGLWNEIKKLCKASYLGLRCNDKNKQDDRARQGASILDDDIYDIIWSQILALDPLPFLYKVFSMVQQEENHKRMMVSCDHKQESVAAHLNTVVSTSMRRQIVLNSYAISYPMG